MARNQKDETFDYDLRLKDAGAVAASAAAQVGGAAKVLDVGAARVDARTIVDVSAITVGAADQLYGIEMQFSNDSTFATGVVIGPSLRLGHQTATGASAASTVGRYELPWTNEVNGVTYRYARAYTRVAGTGPSINYTANVFKRT